jgi:putative acetyltransferase
LQRTDTIEAILVDPRAPAVAALVHELDRYMNGLYPAESNHLVGLDTLSASDVRFFAVYRGTEPVGCGAIMLREDYAEVKRIYISPRARGLGLGKLILDRLEQEARALGFVLMRLETGTLQPEALSLFAAMGFRPRGPFGGYSTDDPYSVFMEKQL